MRKEAKQSRTIELANIQGYHAGSSRGNYAYQGFKSNKYFTSDRYIKLDANFNRPDGKPLQGYGLEIETECASIKADFALAQVFEKIIFQEFPDDLFKMQHDGSRGGSSSAECITQVMSKLFIRNQYSAFKAMYNDWFKAFEISCTSGRCGMHVNISNAVFGASEASRQEAVKKLLYIVNKHYSLFCNLTNRDTANTYYCRRMIDYTDKEACKAADLGCMPSSHGNCCNFSHYPEGRIELRIVGGQSNFGCFRNTMESIFHVVEAVKKLSWKDLDDITKIFAGCNQYVFDRLNTKVRNAGCISDEQLETIRPTVKFEQLL